MLAQDPASAFLYSFCWSLTRYLLFNIRGHSNSEGIQYPKTFAAFRMFSRMLTPKGHRVSQEPHCTHSEA